MSESGQPGETPDSESASTADSEATGAAAPEGLDAELVELLDEEATQGSDVENLVTDLERVSQERDEYLDGLRRLQAEFENYKKAVAKRESDARLRANDSLVNELLPVLDACAMAAANGSEDVLRVQSALVEALTRQGLEVLDPTDAAFDPEQHEAVMHEDVAGLDGLVVAEVLRTGYGWKGHVIRPAMVKTQG